MKNKTYSNFLHTVNTEKWNDLKQKSILYSTMLEYLDRSEPKEKIIKDLQVLCFEINNTLRKTIDYLQLKENLNILNSTKEKIYIYSKDLNETLHKSINELKNFGTTELIDYDKLYFDYLELTPKTNKETSIYAYEIEKEFKEFIKIEAQETKEAEAISNFIIEKNPFPDVFTGIDNKNYLIFKSFTEKYIIDRYNDFSFIIQKMKQEKRITRITHFELMQWLRENNFISEKTYDDFTKKGTFTTHALKKAERLNSYNLIIIDIDKRNSE